VEINQKQQYQPGQEQQDAALTPDSEMNGVSEDIPVVRSNTPRPLSFASMLSQVSQEQGDQPNESFQLPRFPSIAPSAPPLPEELAEEDEVRSGEIIPANTLASPDKAIMDSGEHEFTWLFEYGLEMDSDVLNSAEHLNGAALRYGPVVLKGYTLVLGSVERQDKKEGSTQTVATIVADTTPGGEVWGVLYRIPRRFSERVAGGPSLLDAVHSARTAQSLFCEVQVTVNDPKRKREITCVTYVVNENVCRLIAFVPIGQATDTLFVQRLLETARKHKLPDRYLGIYSSQQAAAAQVGNEHITVTATKPLLDTDPLPAMKEKSKVPTLANTLPETPLVSVVPQSIVTPTGPVPSRLLMAFAIYLVITLLGGLAFAVVQGLGFVLPVSGASFAPLDVPWLVMFYGLLGGCVSCIVMLVHYRTVNLPHFVIVGWFTRPYIGAVLAALAYLVLNSGIFALRTAGGQQQALSLLAGAIAGLCEGWIFFRWK
jgi:cation transport regulator ChaC